MAEIVAKLSRRKWLHMHPECNAHIVTTGVRNTYSEETPDDIDAGITLSFGHDRPLSHTLYADVGSKELALGIKRLTQIRDELTTLLEWVIENGQTQKGNDNE